jgi:hypothetical protein
VSAPTTYTFSGTAVLKSRLQPTLTQFGVGSFCNGALPTGPVGIVDSGGDFSILTKGGPLDVACTFRTKEWILPPGVRLRQLRWTTTRVGNRCGSAGTFSAGLPSLQLPLTRGAVVVRPDASQTASDFEVFSDTQLAVDGVVYGSNLSGPTAMIAPMAIGTECASMGTILVTSQGKFGPTLDPQSFRVTLDQVVLEGPPNLTLP